VQLKVFTDNSLLPLEADMTDAFAYVLRGPDINARYYDGAPNGVVCPECGSCLNQYYVPATLRVQEATRYDFGHTQDLQPLFSKTLVDIINHKSKASLAANELRDSGGYFHLTVAETIEFDVQRRKTRLGPRCRVCGQFEWTAGATPAFLIGDQIPSNGILKTDLEFGDRHGKSPLLIVGRELKEAIESYRLPGIYFADAHCSNERRLKDPADKVH
jgi:hypothetical protein